MLTVFASVLFAVPSVSGAQSGGLEVELPSNTDCRGAVVIAKATVVEDAAAANMLAEALQALSPGGNQRCLLDAGYPSPAARSSAGLASAVHVVGGPRAVPDAWLADRFGVTGFVRVAGADRWQTQQSVAAAIVALANGGAVQPFDPESVAAASLDLPPNGDCYGTAVLAKLTIAEERAAANMLATALTAISGDPDSRCLIDVGDPGGDVPPTAVSVTSAHQAAGAYLLGGTVAVPQAWLDNDFDIRFLERISGPDRWATQAAVAQTMIDIAQGGTLPHQYVDEAGDIISTYEDWHINESAVLRGDPRALFADLPTKTESTQAIRVHYCARASSLDDATEEKKANDEIASAVQLLNSVVSEFFEDQSSGQYGVMFTSGDLFRYNAEDPQVDDWDKGLHSSNMGSKACMASLSASSPFGSLVIVNQPPVLGGFAHDPQQAAVVSRTQVKRPTWLDANLKWTDAARDSMWLGIVAHEMGHAWLALCHPHTNEDDHDKQGFTCHDGHDKLTYSKSLDGGNERSRDDPDLCALMSYCWFESVIGAETFFDKSTGGPVWIGCGQRKMLDWPDGPPTPYGRCEAGRHLSLPRPVISAISSEWLSDRNRPHATVVWDSSIWPSCVSHIQVSQEKNPTWRNIAQDGNWLSLPASAAAQLSLDRDSTYSVKLRYRCPNGPGEYVESEWSDARTVKTPAHRTGRVGRPGPLTLSLSEDDFLQVSWPEVSGVVVRHEVQWKAARDASGWQSRIQQNAGSFFGTDGLTPGICYEFRVRAGDSVGWSDWSSTAEFCTTGIAPLPKVVIDDLSAGSDSIRVTWSVQLVNLREVLDNVKDFEIQLGCESSAIAPTAITESAPASARSFTIDGLEPGPSLPNGRSCQVRVAAVGPNGETGTFSEWAIVTVGPPKPPGSVRISEGPINPSRTASGSCSGSDCRDLRYTINGLGSGPYALECRFDGTATWSGQWSGNASAGCYYSAAFTGTIQVVIDGTPSNTISVTASRRAPDAPGRPSLRAGDGEIGVSWLEPASNGAAIDRYEITARGSDGSSAQAQVSGSTSATLTGLTNGVSYSVRVRARNSVGWGSWSSASSGVPQAAASPPDKPGGMSVSAGDGQVSVSWTGSSANGSPVTGYTVSWSGGGERGSRRVDASERRYVITGLANGPGYTVSVVAHNSVGDSAASSVAAFPKAAARVPDAPRSLSLSAGDGEIKVSWRASAENGAAVTGYLVAWSDGVVVGGKTVFASERSYTISNLRNGSRYEVEVVAQSSAGTSSSASGYATPQAAVSAPDAPGRPSLTPRDGSLLVSWIEPDDNGAAIDRYEVRYRRSGRSSWSVWDGSGSSRRLRVTGTPAGTTYEVQVRARNSVTWGPWSPMATATTDQPQASVTISAGPVNSRRTNSGSCGGNNCHDLRYTINGLGSGPYATECWFNGRLPSGAKFNWTGNASTGCYYGSTFRGTIYVVIDGVKSNTITIR